MSLLSYILLSISLLSTVMFQVYSQDLPTSLAQLKDALTQLEQALKPIAPRMLIPPVSPPLAAPVSAPITATTLTEEALKSALASLTIEQLGKLLTPEQIANLESRIPVSPTPAPSKVRLPPPLPPKKQAALASKIKILSDAEKAQIQTQYETDLKQKLDKKNPIEQISTLKYEISNMNKTKESLENALSTMPDQEKPEQNKKIESLKTKIEIAQKALKELSQPEQEHQRALLRAISAPALALRPTPKQSTALEPSKKDEWAQLSLKGIQTLILDKSQIRKTQYRGLTHDQQNQLNVDITYLKELRDQKETQGSSGN